MEHPIPTENIMWLGGLRIDEPAAVITDLVWTGFCWFFAWRIHKHGKQGLIHTYYKWFFILLGLAVGVGGILGHAIFYRFDFNMNYKLPGWLLSMVATVMLERAAIEHTRKAVRPGVTKFLGILNIFEFITFLSLAVIFKNFAFIEAHSAYGMVVVVFSLEILLFLRTRDATSKFSLIGVFFGLFSGAVHIFEIAPSVWFDNLALCHLFMCVAVTFLYMGAMRVDMEKVPDRIPLRTT